MPSRFLTKLGAIALATVALGASASCASAGTLYNNSYTDQQLVGLSIGTDGLLTSLAGSPFAVGHYPQGIATTPDGRMLVTSFPFSTDELLTTNLLAADGAVSATPAASISSDNVGAPAVSPDGNYVYLPAAPGGVLVYRLGADGSLTPIGGPYGSADNDMPAVTPDGRFVLLSDYDAGAIERLAVGADGSLTPLGTVPVGIAGAGIIRITPDGRFAVLLSDPEGVGDIRTFAIGLDGSLTATGSALATDGTISGTPVLAPSGRFYYNPNNNEGSVSAYSLDATGALSSVGAPVPSGFAQLEALSMSVDGSFLYALRQYAEEIQAFSVAKDGTLAKIGSPTLTGGESDGSTPVPRPATPTARFTAKAAAPGKKTAFDATSSFDLGAKLTIYAWDFGDGKTEHTTGPTTTHVYEKAGVYDVKLAVGDDAGCIDFIYTGQTAYCNARAGQTTTSVDTLPAISKLKVSKKRFAAASASKKKAKRRGTAFSYTLSEKASVVFTIQRKRIGRKAGKTCRPTKQKPKKRRCALLKPLGSFKAAGKAGKNTTRFSGKVKGRKLKPGLYVATAIATDTTKGSSAPASVGFKVIKPTR